MNNKRITSIVPYKILPAQLGGEKGIALFNEYLGEIIPITAIATKNNNPSFARNYKLRNTLSNRKFKYVNPLLYFKLRRIIRQTKATHLLIEHPYFGWLAWLLKWSLPITFVVHSHNIEYMRSKSIGRWWWKALKWYEQWVYKKADIVFFISEDDKKHAIEVLKTDSKKSHAITFGVEIKETPTDIEICKQRIRALYNIDSETKILLFNGALYHHTNYDALSAILELINPVLLQQDIPYRIIVCVKGLPEFFNELKDYRDKNIIYAGFVDDITIYFKAADIFLNPIISGGGVKTKAIEAIAMNCTVISTTIGALGLVRKVCGDKLQVVEDKDWKSFAEQTIGHMKKNESTPASFYGYYYWGNIAKKVADILDTNA